MNYCSCGCDNKIQLMPHYKYTGIPLYLHGHNSKTNKAREKVSKDFKGKKLSEEHKKRISIGNIGHIVTMETREKISEANKGSNNHNYGKHPSDETRKKLSEASKGRYHSEEAKRKMSENNARFFLGKKLSEEHKRKIGEAGKGRKHTEESKKKMSLLHSGKKLTEEHKKNLSEALRGKKRTEEWKRKIGEGNKGKVISEETKRKISEARIRIGIKPPSMLGKHHSDEARLKMSKARKGKKLSEARRKQMSMISTGRKHTEATKKKMSMLAIGNTNALGNKLTEATKRKMSIARKGIPLPSMQGNKHPNWQGGTSFEPYIIDWTETLRQSIRERDHYTCQICGMPQSDKAYCVHHIDYDKKNCNPNNLITLCRSCHTKTNTKREYWKTTLVRDIR